MGVFDWIVNAFPQVFGNPIIVYSLVGVMILIVYFFFFRKGEVKQNMKLLYFAEVESLLTMLDVTKITPRSVYSDDDKRFMRRARSWLWKYKGQSLVVWLAKVGKGLTYGVETNKKDKKGKTSVVKIGSLLEGIENCLQIKEPKQLEVKDIDEKAIEKLRKSEIFVCVDLEEHTSELPDITEEGAITEANRSMADLVGMKIKQQMSKEDWIRNGGLMAMGALVYIIATQLGLL